MSLTPDAIRILDPSVAQRIAAGEVVERPAGVVRELIDNSIDAGATRIEVAIDAGGIDAVSVVDNGRGMTPADLERCVLPHATSKITSVDDLQHVETLGFRGEALASIAAVSSLRITSGRADGTPHTLHVEAGRTLEMGPAAGAPGTSVEVAKLFYNVPARKQFMKRAASESSLVRTTLLDKALPFPDIELKFFSNGELKTFLPIADQVSRIVAAYPERTEPSLLQELHGTGDGFSLKLVAGEPRAHRKDRKQLQVFVNRRRVSEYALIQAVEYAYRDYLHGGLYPSAYLFLDVDPHLVDFNIHPAKREVRFHNLAEIHKRVVATLRQFLRSFDHRSTLVGQTPLFGAEVRDGNAQRSGNNTPGSPSAAGIPDPSGGGYASGRAGGGSRPVVPGPPAQTQRAAFDLSRTFSPSGVADRAEPYGPPHAGARSASQNGKPTPRDGSVPLDASGGFRYLGQVMNLFFAVEIGETLYLVDQHAAHERVIFDRLKAGNGGQELLFPIRLEIPEESAPTLAANAEAMRKLGIVVEKEDSGYELASVPAGVPMPAEELAVLLMELIDRPDDFERELFASLSCRSAVMDGDIVAPEDAVSIIEGVIGLDNARCPHGRPVWVAFTKEQLAQMVGRT